jgi:hypothetical protein
MDKRLIASVAAIAGVIVGVAGASVVLRAQASPANVACAPYDASVDVKADAIVKKLHAHDHDQYIPQPVTPIGELPKAPPREDSTSRKQ